MNPIKDQTDLLMERIWPLFENITEQPQIEPPNDKQLKDILIDLESGSIDKYQAYDLILVLFSDFKQQMK